MPSTGQSVHCHRFNLSTGWECLDARVITEATVSLSVNGEHWLDFTCTPTDLDALAAGFLFNENIIQSRDDVAALDVCKQGDQVDVWLHQLVERPRLWRRTSGCTGGVTTGGASQNRDEALSPPILNVPAQERLDPRTVIACMEQLLQVQELYREVRGVHCSALSDGQTIQVQAEDIGRHNTLDKLAGHVLLHHPDIRPKLVLTTGRVSSEMLQKSARLGAVAVISRTSPTSESVTRADQAGITLIGYTRRNQFIVYAHHERLDGSV